MLIAILLLLLFSWGDKVTMVGFDDGPSISFTSWVIAPTYPRKIVKPTYPRKIVKPHPKILSFNPDGSTFGLQAFWKFREQYTLNAIDMK